MARARNIKPGFFKNELLAEVEMVGRLLFAGLWTIADREGRLEDRPKRIKADLLPYDNCNIDKLLQTLHDKKFILRYQIDGVRYIQILKFLKHQNPHKNEAPSEIPEPECTELNDKSTVQEQDNNNTTPADSLNSDSLNFNIDFLAEFEKWWKRYPRKYGKADSLKEWIKLRKSGVSVGLLEDALNVYLEEIRLTNKETKYILHGRTFLGPGKRWEDYLHATEEEAPPPREPTDDEIAMQKLYEEMKQDGAFNEHDPAPGH